MVREQRKLAAIIAADVVGYSRLMGRDESGTLARLREHRKQRFEPALARHGGRLVKLTGDGALAEFASAVDALAAAIEFQQAMVDANLNLPADDVIVFRIGLHLGDLIVEEDDIYGDSVNVAARLEGEAPAGGIVISGDVHNAVAGRLKAAFHDLGELALKNIDRPVRTFRVDWNAADWHPGNEARPSSAREAGAPSFSGGKPTIAVLPFTNMSGDPEQEFFADGLTEDILTELSRFRDLFVVSRNSVFVYKGKAVNVQSVARELGVQYVAEGSVRKASNRVRITAQLIEAETDRHVWAERYDRELKDIFDIQDEVTSAIAAILPGRVEAAVGERVKRKAPENLAAWELVLTAKRLHHNSTPTDNAEALQLLGRAIALEPGYAHAHAWRACTLGQAFVYGWRADRDAVVAEALEEVNVALGLDDNDSDVHRLLSAINLSFKHDHERALQHQERALALNPNDDLIVVQQGEVLTWMGRGEEGVEWIRKAMRLNPFHPERFWSHLGRAHFVARQYREAAAAFAHVTRPDAGQVALLAACRAAIGEGPAATALINDLMAKAPDFTISAHLALQHYQHAKDLEHHRAMLAGIGLPE
ncbi:MAG: adenylate/guanylate cyclase domain-containing protein [Alphaproteobacteria bacterium]|nr:adenylate/guanylate cyclase domain-containing protein [Alphaproteobacteria bacterium]